MKKQWIRYLFWIALCEAVGGLSALLTKDGMKFYMESVQKPHISPPPILFPIVWSILFALMGIGMTRIRLAPASTDRNRAQNVFIAQLIVNFFWTLLFFNVRVFSFAFIWILLLWLLILLMIVYFRRVDRTAAYLQIPYLLWVSFAAYLNFLVWQLNK